MGADQYEESYDTHIHIQESQQQSNMARLRMVLPLLCLFLLVLVLTGLIEAKRGWSSSRRSSSSRSRVSSTSYRRGVVPISSRRVPISKPYRRRTNKHRNDGDEEAVTTVSTTMSFD